MKKCLIFVVGLFLVWNAATASASEYGLTLGYGVADPDIDVYRLGVKKEFSSKWFESNIGYVSGYFELSYNLWEHNGDETNGVAFLPVFAYYFAGVSNRITPYIEGGIGLAFIDDYHIAGRNLSTNFQFEDKIGIGVRIGSFDLGLKYLHYSNASIKGPNQGINIIMLAAAVQF